MIQSHKHRLPLGTRPAAKPNHEVNSSVPNWILSSNFPYWTIFASRVIGQYWVGSGSFQAIGSGRVHCVVLMHGLPLIAVRFGSTPSRRFGSGVLLRVGCPTSGRVGCHLPSSSCFCSDPIPPSSSDPIPVQLAWPSFLPVLPSVKFRSEPLRS